MATTFQISAAGDGAVRLVIGGELDNVTTPRLRDEVKALLSRKPRRLEVDLSQLQLIDSSGVGMVVSLYKAVRDYGGQITITGLRDQPLAIFRLLKLDRGLLGK
jgi:anti-sigma B factor antagonist